MTERLHLGDEVELVTDSFPSVGASRGTLGVIVGDWADGSQDVEVCDVDTGRVIAQFRAAESDIRARRDLEGVTEPRRHGILFGRGDDLGAPPGDPPSPPGSQFGGLPGRGTGAWFGSEIPPEGTLTPDVPWELKDEPPTGPIFN
jgi:hypothetical protein